jgi:hypothetical protein
MAAMMAIAVTSVSGSALDQHGPSMIGVDDLVIRAVYNSWEAIHMSRLTRLGSLAVAAATERP